jgi:MFS family permease
VNSPGDATPPHMIAKAFVAIAGPSAVSLIAVGIAPALPSMATYFASRGPSTLDWTLFSQLILTLPAVMLILGAPLAGMAVERFGRRRVLLSSSLLFTVSGSACLFISEPITLIGARLLLGIAGAGMQTSCLSLASEFPEGGMRERVLGFMVSGASIVAMGALIVGGHLVDVFGWRAPFALYLAGLAVFAVGAYSLGPDRRIQHRTGGLRNAIVEFWPTYLLVVFLTVAMFMPSIQTPFLLQAQGIASATAAGVVASAASIMATVSAGCYGWIICRLPKQTQIAMTAACFGTGCAVMAVANDNLIVLIAASGVIGIGSGLVEPIAATIILRQAHESIRARAVGLMLSAIFLGQFLNPLTLAPARHAFGLEGMFMLVGAAYLLAALAFGASRRRPEYRPSHSKTQQ